MDNATAGSSIREDRPLESISHAAQRVNTATVRIESFLGRFNGVKEPESPSDPRAVEPSVPYSDSLVRLFSALDRLETRVEGLDRLG